MLNPLLRATGYLPSAPATHPVPRKPSRFRPQLQVCEDRIAPSVSVWDGGGDGVHWSDYENWEDDVHGFVAGNDALIASSETVIDQNASVNSLVSSAALSVQATLNLAGNSAVTGFFDLEAALNVADDMTLTLTGGGELAHGVNLSNAGARLELPSGTVSLLPGFAATGSGFVVVGTAAGGAATTLVAGTVSAVNVELRSGILDGVGTLSVTNKLVWNGGTMKGPGITQIAAGAVMNVTYGNAGVTQDGRTLLNYGTLNWSGGNGLWALAADAAILNYGTFNINPVLTNLTEMENGSLYNAPTGVISRVSGSGITDLNVGTLINDGTMIADVGVIRFQFASGTSTGIFRANLGASFRLDLLSGITLNPAAGNSHALQGQGWFIVDSSITIAENAVVEADNFQLAGVLTGFGTLQAHNLLWTTGSMTAPATPPLQTGTTEILAGGNMTIYGAADFSLTKRIILNRGTIDWGVPGAPSGDIQVRDLGSIVNDAGVFRAWNDRMINNVDNKAGDFILQNNGIFEKPITEYLGTTTIGLMVRNNGGTVQADGSVNFAGGYEQTHASSELNLGIGEYPIAGTTVSIGAGLMTLGGGEIVTTKLDIAANFAGSGTIESWVVLSGSGRTFDLQGNLSISSNFYQQIGNTTRLSGFTLTVGLTTNDGAIQLGGGTLAHHNGTAGQIQNSGLISGPGTINAGLLNRNGGNIAVGGGAAGVLNVLGDFTQRAGATLFVEIGGTASGQFSRFVVVGQATLDGYLAATLINNYSPSEPDWFEVMTFGSLTGAFANSYIDLGGGTLLQLDYDANALTLVTID